MIAIDSECLGLDLRHGALPFFVTICDEQQEIECWEWPVDPLTRKPNIPPGEIKEICNYAWAVDGVVMQNAKFDVAALDAAYSASSQTPGAGAKWPWKRTWDTILADHLINSSQPHDLTSMAKRHLGIDIAPLEKAVEKACTKSRNIARHKLPKWAIAREGREDMPSAKAQVWKYDMWLPKAICRLEPELLPPDIEGWKPGDDPELHPWWMVLANYANADSAVTMMLYQWFVPKLKEVGLWEIYVERSKIVPILYRMESRGVTINAERLNSLMAEFEEQSERSSRICINIAESFGYDLELPKSSRNKSLEDFVFNHLKLPVLAYTDNGNPSFDKEVLDDYEASLSPRTKQHRFIYHLKGKRKRDTAITFMRSYKKYWKPLGTPGWYYVHSSLNPTATATLRCSSSNPNQQQISKQENFNLRGMFGPAPGREWWSLDYENIELKIPAYESGEKVMIELFEKPDDPPYFGSYHLMNASIIYPDLFWPLAEQKGEFKKRYVSTWYQWCKNFGFAVQYGAMPESGTADRAAHKEGAHRMVVDRLKKLSKLNEYWINFAAEHGFVETLPDKTVNPHRGYPLQVKRSSWGKVLPTVPLSYHVQSTAMWCTLKAMVRIEEYHSILNETKEDYFITIQAHDEIVLDYPYSPNKGNLPYVRRVARLMRQSGDDIGIPLTTSMEYHSESWQHGESCL